MRPEVQPDSRAVLTASSSSAKFAIPVEIISGLPVAAALKLMVDVRFRSSQFCMQVH